MRVTKIFRFGKTRLDVGVDAENLFSTNYPTAYDSTYRCASATRRLAGRGTIRRRLRRGTRLNFTVSF
jgi:hypothetical protein